jgi:hypothetical protein
VLTDEQWKRLEDLADEMPPPEWRDLTSFWNHVLWDRTPYEVAETVRITAHDMLVGIAIRDALAEIKDLRQEIKIQNTCFGHDRDCYVMQIEELRARNEKLERVAEAALQWWNATTEGEIVEGAQVVGDALVALREAGVGDDALREAGVE